MSPKYITEYFTVAVLRLQTGLKVPVPEASRLRSRYPIFSSIVEHDRKAVCQAGMRQGLPRNRGSETSPSVACPSPRVPFLVDKLRLSLGKQSGVEDNVKNK